MCTTQTRLTKQAVIETETYKGLTKFQKRLTGSRNNLQHIQEGRNVARKISYDCWVASTNYYYINRLIIKELLDDEKQ